MKNLNNVDMKLNANNPEEEMKMTNLNNVVNGVAVEGLNKEEKMMVELNEKREIMMAAIERELMQEVIDMVVVGDYEEILADIEWEIIELLSGHDINKEEFEMENEILNVFDGVDTESRREVTDLAMELFDFIYDVELGVRLEGESVEILGCELDVAIKANDICKLILDVLEKDLMCFHFY